MTTFTQLCNDIFNRSTICYHNTDSIDAPEPNPFEEGTIEHTLFHKNWIDAVQWHMEDIIRDVNIDPVEALKLKRRIDDSNQRRTDCVEELDTYFRNKYSGVTPLPDATINNESPAWAIDRLSILALKIYHMQAETQRADASESHKARCNSKLSVLLEQRADLTQAIDTLLDDIAAGRKYMKVYRQMKMYNDPDTNPVLYGGK